MLDRTVEGVGRGRSTFTGGGEETLAWEMRWCGVPLTRALRGGVTYPARDLLCTIGTSRGNGRVLDRVSATNLPVCPPVYHPCLRRYR